MYIKKILWNYSRDSHHNDDSILQKQIERKNKMFYNKYLITNDLSINIDKNFFLLIYMFLKNYLLFRKVICYHIVFCL